MLGKQFTKMTWAFLPLIALVGCGTSAAAVQPNWTPVTEIPKFEFPVGRNWRATFDFLPTFQQDKKVFSIWQELIDDCMSSKSLKYKKVHFYGDAWVDSLNPLDRDLASNFGYHDPSRSELVQDMRNMDPAYQDVFESCSNIAAQKTYLQIQPMTTKLQSILNKLVAEYTDAGNSAVNSATSRWASCMADKGIQDKSQEELSLRYSRQKSISNDEIKVRLEDLACDEEAMVTKERSHAERVAIQNWMRNNVESLAEMRQIYAEISKRIDQMS